MELQFENITKNYKGKKVLKGILHSMGTGGYGLLGPNGAGKTTMIRILADVLRPTKGSVLYDGKDILAAGDDYRAKIGYLPQDVSFYSAPVSIKQMPLLNLLIAELISDLFQVIHCPDGFLWKFADIHKQTCHHILHFFHLVFYLEEPQLCYCQVIAGSNKCYLII